MDKKDIVNKTVEKLAQAKNTYTSRDIANLAKQMKESNPREIEPLWSAFAEKHSVSKDKEDEILIDKLKVVYQLDLKSEKHKEALDNLISELKKRDTWT